MLQFVVGGRVDRRSVQHHQSKRRGMLVLAVEQIEIGHEGGAVGAHRDTISFAIDVTAEREMELLTKKRITPFKHCRGT